MKTPKSLLVVAPHPDDEAIAAHALVARLRRRGVAVQVLVVTDGRASHPGSAAWPRARLVAERRRETRAAMRRIGVAAGAVTFLNLPDGDLAAHAGKVRHGIGRAAARVRRPAAALVPAIDDDHADHRVVAACAAQVAVPGLRWFAYPVWPAGNRLPGAKPMPLTAQERLAKRHAIRRYATQTGRITDDPAGFTMTRAQIAAFSRPQECFVAVRR
ncbi:PIG-L deacetylase family protein [Sphingomonas carotinifaciens]|uniref:N-acetylglucosaminyl deacetylase, LmbE family n=1 Tax=Sphingomonas carotinifaciens TaxID=1166323 RepID=A0A1G7MDP2_9SPHN|nr:PIG-L family deacetylase [Sphingomonas carotinifaciens]MBB4086863.1 LmbE family N-acetylglucosaminyl deacetylase [Sphingomonas carotinifaciens]MWC42064.1 PIG-L family deacetylase [Sphingomonas carotinifaciens]SDF59927.1 N-acetylglucosaminyl deacetylase, LmbE family [Sphingomonas carotinifaciens]